jgi:adenylate cyclase 3
MNPPSPSNHTTTEDVGSVCLYPSYFSYFCVLVLVAASLPAQVSHLVKAGLLFLIAGAHCCMNVFVIGPALDSEEATNHRDWAKWVLLPSHITATVQIKSLGLNRYILNSTEFFGL